MGAGSLCWSQVTRQRRWCLIQESHTASIQSVVWQEEKDRAVPIANEVEVPEARMSGAISEGLVSLDTVDEGRLFSLRALVMKCPPKFLRGAYRAARGKFVQAPR